MTGADLVAFARVTTAGEGTAVGDAQPWVDAAVGHVQARCGWIAATDVRVAAWCDGRSRALMLPCGPVAEVAELVSPSGVDVVASLGASDVDWAAAVVQVSRVEAGEWVARVTTATTAERTAALKQAVLIIAAHLWGARAGAARPGAGAAAAAAGPGYAIPNRATELMAPYARAGVA